jgi:hypothetical protein
MVQYGAGRHQIKVGRLDRSMCRRCIGSSNRDISASRWRSPDW